MDFSLDKISFSNLFLYDFDPFLFSIMGMLIVFGGLTIISLYITVLPRLLAVFEKKERPGLIEPTVEGDSEEAEILLAIAVALHLEQTSAAEEMKITWPRHQEPSSWQAAGRIRGLAVRSHLARR